MLNLIKKQNKKQQFLLRQIHLFFESDVSGVKSTFTHSQAIVSVQNSLKHSTFVKAKHRDKLQ